jgi:hypothetical protein
MRELKTNELDFVSGGLVCTEGESGNELYGISRTNEFGRYLINLYEGAIEATSYMIERVANAW